MMVWILYLVLNMTSGFRQDNFRGSKSILSNDLYSKYVLSHTTYPEYAWDVLLISVNHIRIPYR